MTLKAYLDNIQAKTGKTPDDFRALAQKKGLVKTGDLLAWLQADFGLGRGHAMAIVHVMQMASAPKISRNDKIAAHFAGKKSIWRKPYDGLMKKVAKFGVDISVSPTNTYLSLLRGKRKFALLEPATPERLDVGLKLKGIAPAGRLEASGSWNSMVTHRVRIGNPKELDAELLAWLKQAYEAV
jgi:hypothetical protein